MRIAGKLCFLLLLISALAPQGRMNAQSMAGWRLKKAVANANEHGIQSLITTLEIQPALIPSLASDTGTHGVELRLWLVDENGIPVPRAERREKNFALNDTFQVVQKFSLSRRTVPRIARIVFPHWQLSLSPGSHQLRIAVSLQVLGSAKVKPEFIPALGFEKKPTMIARFQLRGYEMDTTGSGAGAWDFALFNKKEKPPDLEWLLLRGEDWVHRSLTQSNRTRFEGDEEDITRYFLFTQGDEVTLSLRDYDVTSFSDIIGNKRIVLSGNGSEVMLEHFDNVKVAVYKCWVEEAPRFDWKNLSFTYGQMKGMPSGRVLRAGFQSFWPWPEGQAWVALQCMAADSIFQPPCLELTSPSHQLNDRRFTIADRKGVMEMVLPHYALTNRVEGRKPTFHLMAGKVVGDMVFMVPQVNLPELALPSTLMAADEFSCTLTGAHQSYAGGIACLSLNWRLQMPAAYVTDLPQSQVVMECMGLIGNRPVPVNDRRIITLHSLRHLRQNENGMVVMEFSDEVPLFKCPASGTTALLDLRSSLYLQLTQSATEDPWRAGYHTDTVTVNLPTLLPVELDIENAVLTDDKVKDKRIAVGIYLGDHLVHQGASVPGDYHVRWDESASFLASPGDSATVLILHTDRAGGPVWIGKWQGRVEELMGPANKKIKLKGPGIQRLQMRVRKKRN